MENVTDTASDVISEQAFMLLGEPHEVQECLLGDFCIRLGLELEAGGLSDENRKRFTNDTAVMICQRVAQWQSIVGHA
jgi:hypothetical protein